MKTKKRVVGAACAVGLMALSLMVVTAYGGPRNGRMSRGGLGILHPRVLRAVDLTEEQKTQIREIRRSHRETRKARRSEFRAVRAEISEKFLGSAELQAADLDPQVERLAALQKQRIQEALKIWLEVRAVLTPEQLANAAKINGQLQALREEMRSLLQRNE